MKNRYARNQSKVASPLDQARHFAAQVSRAVRAAVEDYRQRAYITGELVSDRERVLADFTIIRLRQVPGFTLSDPAHADMVHREWKRIADELEQNFGAEISQGRNLCPND